MHTYDAYRETIVAGLARAAADAAIAEGPEEALWVITRMLPSLLGDRAAAINPANLPAGVAPQTACTCFMRTPDGRHHLICAPVNFQPEQYHEKVAITLGHPGVVAKTKRPLLLRDTSHHESFVKILQTFRAGSVLQVPLLWKDECIGVLICANVARNVFSEVDLQSILAFSGLTTALWMAHGGPAWLRTIDYSKLPERTKGS